MEKKADSVTCPACGRQVPTGPDIPACVLCGAPLPKWGWQERRGLPSPGRLSVVRRASKGAALHTGGSQLNFLGGSGLGSRPTRCG